MKILVLNCGSSSLRFQVIDMKNEDRIVKGHYERVGGKNSSLRLNVRGEKSVITHVARTHEEAISFVLELLLDPKYQILDSLDDLEAIGHRIVHGGEYFNESVLITPDVIEKIRQCIPLAPLHNPESLAGIEAVKKLLPDKPMVAVFDTAFHQTMDKKTYLYQIPYGYYEKYQIRKYGFHGTSHRYVASRVATLLKKDIKTLKIISCHLGQGASICAIKNGKSVDTSMGLTPMSGIPMATRSGDIDPSIVTYLMKQENLLPDEMDKILNKKSGAWGVSGVSEDYRDIEKAYEEGDERSIIALDGQSYKVAQYIAQYMVTLGGADVIIFTGGVGENGYETRERICQYLEFLGVELDQEKNRVKGIETCISSSHSKIALYVIPTNEELMIARDTHQVLQKESL